MVEDDVREIVARLKTLIAEQLDVNLTADAIDESDSFFEGGMGIDSIAIVELIVLTEQQFDVQFGDDELVPEWFRSLRVFAELVAKKRESPAADGPGDH
jgi:acyl carrier protein